MSDTEKALRASAREAAISDGYPAVSRFISSDLDGESYVFRKFRTLTARKLLYMQSQILELEEQLADFDRAAAASPDWELHLAARSWERLIANAESREKEKQIRKVIDEIEVKLDNYRMFLPRAPLLKLLLLIITRRKDRALLLQSQVARVETPPDRVLSAYKDALLSSDGKDALLGGKAQYVLDDADDLAMLSPPKSNDAISHFLRNHWFFKTRVSRPSIYYLSSGYKKFVDVWICRTITRRRINIARVISRSVL